MRWMLLTLAVFFASLSANAETTVLDGPSTKPSSEGLSRDTPGLLGVFFGHLPCDGCQRTKTSLILFKDPAGRPTDYVLERVLVGKGNDRHVTKGSWKFLKDPKRPGALIYRLDSEAPKAFRTYWAVDDRTLLVLDQDLKPLKSGPKDTHTHCVALFSTL